MKKPSPPTDPEILVIGYGSSLRSDDSVGARAAAAVGDWALPGVRAIAAQQLTPELVEPLSAARLVIFVDARRAEAGEPVRVEPIEPEAIASMFVHACNPRGLLAIAQDIFGSRPPAWLVTVPATEFAVGERLSPMAHSGLVAALQTIAGLLSSATGCALTARGRMPDHTLKKTC
jgi:hydrogenase maturation protease